MSNSLPSFLIITNQEPLGLSLTRVVQKTVGQDTPVFPITYDKSPTLLSPLRMKNTDFLILDLFRDYPAGRRAEGIILAERWLFRKPFLIVSPLHIALTLECPGYWDTQSSDNLDERISHILNTPRSCNEGFDRVKVLFSRLLKLPPQH